MSSVNSTASFTQKNDLEKKCKTFTNWEQERTQKEKAVMMLRKTKHQSSQKMRCRLPLRASKKGKASDNNGIRAEDIKTCDDTTKEMIRQIFNEVMKQDDCTPETWRRTSIKVIYNKGDVEEVGNYCPTCTLPALYKLFSTFPNNRPYPRLVCVQLEDQGGFHVRTKRWIILQHTDCLSRSAMSGVSKCGSRRWSS